jgi:hypothetical protein
LPLVCAFLHASSLAVSLLKHNAMSHVVDVTAETFLDFGLVLPARWGGFDASRHHLLLCLCLARSVSLRVYQADDRLVRSPFQ